MNEFTHHNIIVSLGDDDRIVKCKWNGEIIDEYYDLISHLDFCIDVIESAGGVVKSIECSCLQPAPTTRFTHESFYPVIATGTPCRKCSGTGKYINRVRNGKPMSSTGFMCYRCNGSGND